MRPPDAARVQRRWVLAVSLALAGCPAGEDVSQLSFACQTDADCASSYTCVASVCALATQDGGAPGDAGLDAGTDGGALDAGSPDGGLGAGLSLAFSVQPPPSGIAGQPFGTQPVVQIRDGGALATSSTTPISLLPFTDALCTVPARGAFSAAVNPVTPASGSAPFAGVAYGGVGTLYLEASAVGAAPACSTGTTVNPGGPTKLALSGPNTFGVGYCSPAFAVTVDDAQGNAVAGSGVSVALATGTASAATYADPNCVTPAMGVLIPTGASSATFYVAATAQGQMTLTADSAPLTGGSWVVGATSFAGIAVGQGRGYGILGGGLVETWGDTYFGALSNGGYLPSPVPVDTSAIPAGATAVSVGESFDCAIVSGAAQCWGNGVLGQMGNGTNNDHNLSPGQVTGLASGVTALTTGASHACAVWDAGAYCWGFNGDGELGDGTMTNRFFPVPVVGLDAGVVDIAAGHNHTCAVLSTGAVWCWGGDPYFGELGNGMPGPSAVPVASKITSGAVHVTSGADYSCALMASGAIECWGLGTSGQLGNGQNTTSLPGLVVGVPSAATQVSTTSASARTCAVIDGGAYCWGATNLGNGTSGASSVPVLVSGLGAGVTAIATGITGSCAIVQGVVRCWGNDLDGTLGDGAGVERLEPVPVQGMSRGAQAVSTGGFTTCAVRNGGAWCWGDDGLGQLGNDATSSSPVPIQPIGLDSGVLAIAPEQRDSVCAIADGGIWCWGGYNSYGQLGRGAMAGNLKVPAPVIGLSGMPTALAGGFEFYCAAVSGSAWCWGNGLYGELGNGGLLSSSVPVPVTGLDAGVTSVSCGGYFACAVVDGGAFCWGENGAGQLGNGNGVASLVPVPVQGLTGVSALSAGQAHACALANGSLYCWGDNSNGALGTSNTTSSNTPVKLSLQGVTAVAAGNGFTCAVVNGGAQCWGGLLFSVGYYQPQAFGQLGTGLTIGTSTPTPVVGLSAGVVEVSASIQGEYACALRDFGDIVCWGDDRAGQLGDVPSNLTPSPVLMGTW